MKVGFLFLVYTVTSFTLDGCYNIPQQIIPVGFSITARASVQQCSDFCIAVNSSVVFGISDRANACLCFESEDFGQDLSSCNAVCNDGFPCGSTSSNSFSIYNLDKKLPFLENSTSTTEITTATSSPTVAIVTASGSLSDQPILQPWAIGLIVALGVIVIALIALYVRKRRGEDVFTLPRIAKMGSKDKGEKFLLRNHQLLPMTLTMIYSVHHTFIPKRKDELQIKNENVIQVNSFFDDEWAFGTNISSGCQSGYFPLACLVDDEKSWNMLTDNGTGFAKRSQSLNTLKSSHRWTSTKERT